MIDFKFQVSTVEGDTLFFVASGRDDLEAEDQVWRVLELDGEEAAEVELLGEATEDDQNDHRIQFITTEG